MKNNVKQIILTAVAIFAIFWLASLGWSAGK